MNDIPAKALPEFIQLLYAVVLGVRFADFAHGAPFQNLIAGKFKRNEVPVFLLFTSAILFIIADYTVYAWLIKSNPNTYAKDTGAILFFFDIVILSIEYFLISISCSELTARRIESFIVALVLWHIFVCVWWAVDAIEHPRGEEWIIPKAHVIHTIIFLLFWIAFRIMVRVNVSGLQQIYHNHQKIEGNAVAIIFVIVLSLIISTYSAIWFIKFHNRLYELH